MLEPFFWMFHLKDFKKHFLFIFLLGLISYVLGFALIYTPIPKEIGALVTALLWVLPAIYTAGYFWNLTEEIINRDWDIILHNIYDGIIKEYYEIQLPELNIGKNIWRGIASIVAMTLLWIPFVIIIWMGVMSHVFMSLPRIAAILIPLFFAFFAPALLWNYAYKNSIVSVWNIRKAIYLMGNYPFRYLFNTIIFIILAAASSFIDGFAGNFMKVAFTSGDIVGMILSALILFLLTVKNIYLIYVYAYLLGTIAPTSES
ncbi:MAG: hypothetical protein NC408_00210 [Candidatus Gastranaerophilales bacterium]|nr:hypothetical protein [Candidatus Gastranaerophilales bacterium]MCM1072987.1 hypothetical protein [Bacteroides sp.]